MEEGVHFSQIVFNNKDNLSHLGISNEIFTSGAISLWRSWKTTESGCSCFALKQCCCKLCFNVVEVPERKF